MEKPAVILCFEGECTHSHAVILPHAYITQTWVPAGVAKPRFPKDASWSPVKTILIVPLKEKISSTIFFL